MTKKWLAVGLFALVATALAGPHAAPAATCTACQGTDQRVGSGPPPPPDDLPADLGVVTSASPASAAPGAAVTLADVITNHGPGTGVAVVVTDVLPAAATLVSASTTDGRCSGSSTVTCTLPNLANGASATITMVIKLSAPGAYQHLVTVHGGSADSVPANDSAAGAIAVVRQAAPQLGLVGGARLIAGRHGRFAVLATHLRLDEAATVRVSLGPTAGGRSIPLRAGSAVGATKLHASALAVIGAIGKAGDFPLSLVVDRTSLKPGKKYTIIVRATDSNGRTSVLRIATRLQEVSRVRAMRDAWTNVGHLPAGAEGSSTGDRDGKGIP